MIAGNALCLNLRVPNAVNVLMAGRATIVQLVFKFISKHGRCP